LMIQAFAINVALFAISTVAFLLLLKSARKHGSLVQSGE
jgi:ABC-2 type transport system permease protein